MNKMNENSKGIAGVLLASILWGTTGTVATYAPAMSPFAIGSIAMGVGGLLQALIATRIIARESFKIFQNLRFLLIGAIAVAVYPLAFYASMRYAGVTIGTVISLGSAPLLSFVIEYFYDDKVSISKKWVCGAAIGVIGMILLCLSESAHQNEVNNDVILGSFLGLVAGFTYSLYSWAARRMMQKGVAPRAAMGSIFGVGGLLLIPVMIITAGPLFSSWNNVAVSVYMAIIPMFFGYICYGYGLARIPASMATAITLTEPVVAALLAVVLVGERLSLSGWSGVVLIIISLIIITMPLNVIKKRKLKNSL